MHTGIERVELRLIDSLPYLRAGDRFPFSRTVGSVERSGDYLGVHVIGSSFEFVDQRLHMRSHDCFNPRNPPSSVSPEIRPLSSLSVAIS